MSKFYEEKISGETKYTGHIVNLRVDDVKLNNGAIHFREVVEHPGGVVIAALTDENKLILIKQWRYPVQEELIELPAGKLECGEEPFLAA